MQIENDWAIKQIVYKNSREYFILFDTSLRCNQINLQTLPSKGTRKEISSSTRPTLRYFSHTFLHKSDRANEMLLAPACLKQTVIFVTVVWYQFGVVTLGYQSCRPRSFPGRDSHTWWLNGISMRLKTLAAWIMWCFQKRMS